jgi:folylpolyglutamate synthase/dihydrofolate synthase
MPATMRIRQAENWLEQRQMFSIKLGLDTTRALLADLGDPQERLKIIHIAGTNGKGSVGAILLAILAAAGFRTGLYSSPHLVDVRERFRINNTLMEPADFAELAARLATLIAARTHQPTYFECTTLLALMWFAQQGVDAVILETGMGGRLDATNVVVPQVAIITDISHDHEQYLGQTLTAIAGEKAGIIKSSIPTVVSGRMPETAGVIEARCRQLRSPLFMFGRDFSAHASADNTFTYQTISGTTLSALPLPLHGAHQVINAALALATLEVLAPVFSVATEAFTTGLRQVRWPCRLELLTVRKQEKTVRVLLDGAHNEAGVAALVQELRASHAHRNILLIWGNMADKNIGQPFFDLASLAKVIMFTRTESPRFTAPEALFACLPPGMRAKASWCESVAQALAMWVEQAGPDDLVCVTGSLYLAGQARRILVGGDGT